MSEKAALDFTRRFDETYRTLLVIVSVVLSFSYSFHVTALGIMFFIDVIILFSVSIVLWSLAHLFSSGFLELEYKWKLYGWYILTFDISALFVKLILIALPTGVMREIVSFIVGLIILILTLFVTIKIGEKFEDCGVFEDWAFTKRKLYYLIIVFLFAVFYNTTLLP